MSDVSPAAGRGRRMPLALTAAAGWLVILAGFVVLGSDLLWVVALGDVIRSTGSVPAGIPFASAPQVDWPNPIVLSEILLSLVNDMGSAGLASLNILLVALVLGVLVAEAGRMGAGDARTALVVTLVVIGASTSLVIVRLPSVSLVPFVVAVALMRRRHAQPGGGVWWLVPLFLVWGNLHGGVLVGLAVLGVFLAASPGGGGPARRVGVGLASSLCLVLTSAGLDTPRYYLGVLGNEAAARGTDLWAPPHVGNPFDIAMVAAAAVLLTLSLRRGMPLWEWVVVGGLAVGTILAARNGVWLILFLAPRAAVGRPGAAASRIPPKWPWSPLTAVVLVVALAGCTWQLARRGSEVHAPGAEVVAEVAEVADGRPVLAAEPLAETLAQRGVTIWASNPIDAFPQAVQADLLDFLHDARVPESADVEVVVTVTDGPRPTGAGDDWRVVRTVGGYSIYERP